MSDPSPAPPDWVSLDPEERVWLRATPSTNLVLGSLAVGFVVLLAMSLVVGFLTDLTTGRRVSFVVLVLIVVLLVATFVFIRRREYLLTNERVCVGIGLTDKRVHAVELSAVDDVTVEQSWWHRFLNVGTVRFRPNEAEPIGFALVEDPVAVNARVLEFVDLEASSVRRTSR